MEQNEKKLPEDRLGLDNKVKGKIQLKSDNKGVLRQLNKFSDETIDQIGEGKRHKTDVARCSGQLEFNSEPTQEVTEEDKPVEVVLVITLTNLSKDLLQINIYPKFHLLFPKLRKTASKKAKKISPETILKSF